MANGYLLIARESTPGNELNTPTLATKKTYLPIISYTPEPGFSHMLREDELVNTDQPRLAIPLSADPSWSLEVPAYPDVLGELLSCMLGDPTTTAGNGTITDPDSVAVPVGAYKHVWTAPAGPSGASPKTAQHDIAYTDESVFFKAKGAAVQELGISAPADSGVMLSASGPALYFVRQSDPSLTATYEAESVQPFMRRHATLSWLSNSADVADCTVSLTNPTEPSHTFGVNSKWPSRMYKGDAPFVVSGSVPMELIDADDYDALVGATGFTATIKFVSDTIIASAYPYKLYIASDTTGAQYIGGGPEALANTRRRGATFDFRFAKNAGAAWTISLINATSSYS